MTALRAGSACCRAPPAGIPVRTAVATRNLYVILNADSGAGDGAAAEKVAQAFQAAGATATVWSRPAVEIDDALQQAIAAQPDGVIIGGGDGTVRSAAAALVVTGIPLGVLPCGTLNHFARDLGMPTNLADAVKVLAAPAVRRVDVGDVNGHLFINNCSLGAYADAVRRRDALRVRDGRGKQRAMLRASYEVFRRLQHLNLALTSKGRRRTVSSPLVVVANNRYSGHVLDDSMRARLDEGLLWLYTAHVHRSLPALRLALQSLVRRLDEADALESEPLQELIVENLGGALPVAMDGEIVDVRGPLHFRIRPGALTVMAAPAKDDVP